jgi:deoxyribodipyrimidine photo-lyase
MRHLFWFRHDLRLHDNTGFHAACRAGEVVPCVVLDDAFLKNNPAIGPNRCALFLRAVADLARNLTKRGAKLIVRHGTPADEIPRLVKESKADGVYVNRDYEPYAIERDRAVEKAVRKAGGTYTSFKDLVVFESHEILTQAGNPHVIYSRFRDCWLNQELVPSVVPPPRDIAFPADLKLSSEPIDENAFTPESNIPVITETTGRARLKDFLKNAIFDYATQRDIPAVDGTSRLSPHLKFGTLSPRTVIAPAREMLRVSKGAQRKIIETFIGEIVWRDFFFNIMSAFPHVAKGAFRREYDSIRWETSPKHFRAWQDGRTGYPIVDAGMRQLKALGWMHNRVRMITASFLCKDLLIDWREGERHFSRLLIDGEFAVNNGNWQWVAGTGTDAQPYFRIFNPRSQSERFDPQGAYIRQWIPELKDVPDEHIHSPQDVQLLCPDYPPPIVDHAEQRSKALEMYKAARAAK